MKYSELSAKSAADLQKEIKEKRLQLFTLRMKLKTMQLSNTSEIRAVRKDIARMMTALSVKGE